MGKGCSFSVLGFTYKNRGRYNSFSPQTHPFPILVITYLLQAGKGKEQNPCCGSILENPVILISTSFKMGYGHSSRNSEHVTKI